MINLQQEEKIQEHLILFTQLLLGLFKHPIICGKYCNDINTDIKNSQRITLNYLSVEETILTFCPYLFRIDDIENQQLAIFDENNQFIFPNLQQLSRQSIQNSCCYLMDDGECLYLYLGKDLNQTFLNKLFKNIDIRNHVYLLEEMIFADDNWNDLVQKLYNLITELRSNKASKYQILYIIKQGDNSILEQKFLYKLIEDKLDQYADGYNVNYNDFFKLLNN